MPQEPKENFNHIILLKILPKNGILTEQLSVLQIVRYWDDNEKSRCPAVIIFVNLVRWT